MPLTSRVPTSVAQVRVRLLWSCGVPQPEGALASSGFDVSAAGTVPPALTAAFEAEDWESAVRTAVRLGGDTDTLACITGAVAEAIYGLPVEIAEAARRHLTEDLRAVLQRFEAVVRGGP